jgi:hypothetical protein
MLSSSPCSPKMRSRVISRCYRIFTRQSQDVGVVDIRQDDKRQDIITQFPPRSVSILHPITVIGRRGDRLWPRSITTDAAAPEDTPGEFVGERRSNRPRRTADSRKRRAASDPILKRGPGARVPSETQYASEEKGHPCRTPLLL